MIIYKLTDKNDRTHGGCQWGPGVTVETSGEGELCGEGFTHWYTSPLLAVLLNPIHGNFDLATAHLWEGEGEVIKNDRGLKVGCTSAKTLRLIELPVVTLTQKIAFGILCAKEVCKNPVFQLWAKNWLNGTDRSAERARAARAVEWAAVEAAAWAAAEWAAEWAARGAAEAWAAERAARAAAEAVRAVELDLYALALKATTITGDTNRRSHG